MHVFTYGVFLKKAAAAAWTPRGDEGDEDRDGDEHISLVLDESVRQVRGVAASYMREVMTETGGSLTRLVNP